VQDGGHGVVQGQSPNPICPNSFTQTLFPLFYFRSACKSPSFQPNVVFYIARYGISLLPAVLLDEEAVEISALTFKLTNLQNLFSSTFPRTRAAHLF
jgi:hypothetical protein